MHVASDFAYALRDLDTASLDRSESSAYGVRRDGLTLAFCNEAFTRFALDNGSPDDLAALCTDHVSLLALIAPVLRPFYAALYRRVLATGEPESHDYACHSPTTERWFRQRVTPIRDGLLIVNHQTVDRPHPTPEEPPDPARYVDPDTGLAVQCCHCRATRRADAADTWDWVPAYLDRERDDVSHGLCRICFVHYFPDAAAEYARVT